MVAYRHPDRRASLHREQQAWGALRLFVLYRFLLAAALGLAFFSGAGPSLLGRSFPDLFSVTVVVYLGFAISGGVFLFIRSPPPEQQAQIALFIDILAVTFLMHASGGIRSGLGLLMAISIANGSLLMSGRLALLFASLASLAVLTEQVYAQLNDQFPVTAYTQAGMLGVTFFAVTLVSHAFSSRVQESERIARQRGLDLANMAQLNDYVIQHMNTGVLVVGQDMSLRLLNETAWRLLGMPDAHMGEKLDRSLPELDRMVRDWRQDPQTLPATLRIQPGSAEIRPQFASLGARTDAGTLIFLEDSARLTAQVQQMKLASLGRLTASIAHEIRNPLSAISHAGQLLAESPDLAKGDRRLTEIITSNATRVNDIIETVLQLSRRERASPEDLPMGPWLEDFLADFARTRMCAPEIFQLQVEPHGLSVNVDPRQLHQLLVNLCDNALKYAAAEDRPLRVQLTAGLSPERPNPTLDVIDNGPGIDPQDTRQIFEPFFSTGPKGTGLGLYIAKELCEINDIDIEYFPVPSGGSCFRLSFHRWNSASA